MSFNMPTLRCNNLHLSQLFTKLSNQWHASDINMYIYDNSRFGINTAVVPAPIENFFISTMLHLLAL